MSQADMEKAYTEAVDQLARAVEANRLLTERLEQQELTLAEVRKAVSAEFPLAAQRDWYVDSMQHLREVVGVGS